MERRQAITLVRETFTGRFDEARFTLFVRNLVNHLEESKKQVWTLKKDAFKDYVNHFARLGTYTDPRGERVDVLVIHLRKETTLARGRVTLRNFVADYLATGHGQGKAAVIAAFVSPTEDDWRFSFIKLDYTLETTELGIVTERAQLTPARRYSYLVGKNENCHTAQKQFLALLESDAADPLVAALEAAFSVEKVTKEFFEHYRELFEKTRDALADFLGITPAVEKEFDERGITTDDFTKKLLGQIVFLYFLQKKGWFGVERGKDWGVGRKDFLRHLFTQRADYAHTPGGRKREANFFNDILEPLFYEALAYPREADDHYYSRFDCRIPFLNGGLFEPLYGYRWSDTDILLPDALFSNTETSVEGDTGTGILDVFDRYNFTVNEAEPLEKEVAVDPEMLGKVFENLLPENIRHASGTYYTPRVIVHYMCQQALLHYLSARASDIPHEQVSVFLRLAERFADFEAQETKKHADKRLPEAIARNAARLDELLATVTVCDPAIGSGAFPVGMMHEIVRARMALTPSLEKATSTFGSGRTAYEMKRHAIHHSLYGVDFDPGAVEIAKLRLWLSMVVDEDNIHDIQALPNLDYKIMQGNSLLEEFEGVRLFDEKVLRRTAEDDREQRAEELKKKISAKTAEAIRAHSEGRKGAAAKLSAERDVARLKKQLAALVQGETASDVEFGEKESWRRLARLQQLHEEFFRESNRKKKEEKRAELERLEWDFMRATLREQGRETALAELERASAKHRKPFFLWWLHFSEIKQQRGGFDVVIANPPYVRQEEIKEFKPTLKRAYDCYSSTADLFVYFYERAVKLLNAKGAMAFITSNKYFRSGYGEKLRSFLNGKTVIRRIIDFDTTPVFDAIAYPSIILLTSGNETEAADSNRVAALKWRDGQPLEEISEVVARDSFPIPQSDLDPDGWAILDAASMRILKQVRSTGAPLGDWCGKRLYRGILTGLNEAFVINGADRQTLIAKHASSETVIVPFLRGRDVKRWRIEFEEQYLIKIPSSDNFHHPWTGKSDAEAERIFAETLPAIFEFMRPSRAKLIKRSDQGRYYWELRSCAYWDEFQQPKIVIPAITGDVNFAADWEGFLSNNKTSICIPPAVYFGLGVLNSALSFWFVRQTFATKEGGFFDFEPRYSSKLRIPQADDSQRAVIERLVDYVLWLNRSRVASGELPDSAGGMLLAGYFEQWVNALVYELFFPGPLHAAGLHFFTIAEAARLEPIATMPAGQELARLRIKFEELYQPTHPLRQSLFALDSIEEIRIIEGKA